MKNREPLARKAVVTAFLRDGEKILLVRRSGKVGSYQGRWSAISGYLEEPTPLRQALKEIREETGLTESALRLASIGNPLMVEDAALETCWEIHPFLFDLTLPKDIRLDWENLEMRWVRPVEFSDYPTVPSLREALEACLADRGHPSER